jgi:hypothetical protein
MRLLLL